MSKKVAAESFSKWSDLPKELLDLILSKTSFVSIHNIKAVCPSWRNAVKAHILSSSYRGVHQVPLLMLPPEKKDDNSIRFFNLEDETVFKRRISPEEFHKSLFLGTSHGWLVMLDEKVEPYLFNPFTLAQIPLPSLETYADILCVYRSGENGCTIEYSKYGGPLTYIRPIECIQDLRGNFIPKAVVSCNPSHNNGNFFVLMIFKFGGNYGETQLAFYRSGDSRWIRLGEMNEHIDVVCHNDKIFTLTYPCTAEIWDVLDSFPVKTTKIIAHTPQKIFETRNSLTDCCPSRSYLVESSGDLLMVERFIVELVEQNGRSNQAEYRTLLFQVYKLDLSMKKWEEVESLGNQVLFLGANLSKSFSVRDFPVCEANSIYFTDDCWDPIRKHNIHYDFGVFNMEDKSIKSYYQFGLLTEPLPFWIDPTPLLDP